MNLFVGNVSFPYVSFIQILLFSSSGECCDLLPQLLSLIAVCLMLNYGFCNVLNTHTAVVLQR